VGCVGSRSLILYLISLYLIEKKKNLKELILTYSLSSRLFGIQVWGGKPKMQHEIWSKLGVIKFWSTFPLLFLAPSHTSSQPLLASPRRSASGFLPSGRFGCRPLAWFFPISRRSSDGPKNHITGRLSLPLSSFSSSLFFGTSLSEVWSLRSVSSGSYFQA